MGLVNSFVEGGMAEGILYSVRDTGVLELAGGGVY